MINFMKNGDNKASQKNIKVKELLHASYAKMLMFYPSTLELSPFEQIFHDRLELQDIAKT